MLISCSDENGTNDNYNEIFTIEDHSGEIWNSLEMSFDSTVTYDNPFNDCEFDVVFTAPSGKKYKMPGFWDGNLQWKVRFAPTETGEWTYKTVFSDVNNRGLNGVKGKFTAESYTGNLEIYKRGFVKTEPDARYFMYNDGTPFFYLGDTHWDLNRELFNESKYPEVASSHFHYIVDKRVEQGFTVYQSEPLGYKYNFDDGLSEADLEGLQDTDRRFKYIANKGLVHANSQFFAVWDIDEEIYKDKSYLDKLCRLWIARYGSYPVMWTTAQECDNDYYWERGEQEYLNLKENRHPWRYVATKMAELDPYGNPLTAHQESAGMPGTLEEAGMNVSSSAFREVEGHSWYALQWTPPNNAEIYWPLVLDFYLHSQGKPVVNYEGSYEMLWTKEQGSRIQGWTAFLNGMYGHGYGVADIWAYDNVYDKDTDSVRGKFTITVEEKNVQWKDSVNYPSAVQLGHHMRNFFESMEWWKLEPRFNSPAWSIMDSYYSLATISNEKYVAYFWNETTSTGSLAGMKPKKTYTVKWYNPITGEYTQCEDAVADKYGEWKIPEKPDNMDWVLEVTLSG